ncbi:hypothetical protein ACHAW5_005025 [Stephanodiscus triporus]|uniref:Uncharacterized protein n=1 Tax=Stephanodiscus triporus TaxID=2934178 RepID=A0ABD3QA69_9STRA
MPSSSESLRNVLHDTCSPNRSDGVLRYERQWDRASLGSRRRRGDAEDGGDVDVAGGGGHSWPLLPLKSGGMDRVDSTSR